jgi:hypothetical protein
MVWLIREVVQYFLQYRTWGVAGGLVKVELPDQGVQGRDVLDPGQGGQEPLVKVTLGEQVLKHQTTHPAAVGEAEPPVVIGWVLKAVVAVLVQPVQLVALR